MNNLLDSAYNRAAWIDFLQNRLLPDDFKLKRQTVNIAFKSKYIKPQAYWIGDCSSLDDLAIIEISHFSENDPRISVSRDAFRLMAELNLESALFFFVSENSDNYRFSLITLKLELEGTGVKYKFSNPKRFSFYLGPDAKTKTPELFLVQKGRISNFEDLQSRFSIEVVNKEFYREIQTSFYRLVGGELSQGNMPLKYEPKLKLPGNPDTKTRQEFSVRLIGRLVFCWFLKKKVSDQGKPLIPEAVLSKDAVQESYYHRILEPLFFEILNKALADRHPDFRNDTFDDIPYLNGGLFDPSQHQDYYTSSNSQRTALPAWSLKIPEQWFRDFFDILETYNFTIDENTSIDIDLSVDPEMLGRIFENLLAEINPETGQSAKNSSGSFYTPRPIVEFMVDESLNQYLKSKTDIEESLIRDLLDYQKESTELSKAQKMAVLEALDDIKVLDPACGSGAFPIGILQKMLLILQKVDQQSIEWVIKQLDKIPDKQARDAQEEKLIKEDWQYNHKMGIIQNAIYGVDIQTIATEITKLRLFLTLIVDDKVLDDKPNKNIHPLPNLSFKFVTANSLISLGAENETIVRNQNILKDFDDIRERFFQAHSAEEKEQIKIDFNRLNRSLMDKLVSKEYRQSSFLDETQTLINMESESDSYFYKLLRWDPFQDKPSDWFDPKWMFGVEDGFDIVIGNPPYIQLQKAFDNKRKFADLYKDCGYTSFERTGDIYCLFYERGYQMLAPHGHLCYITSNKWMRANYGKSLRRFLAEHTQSKILIDFGGYKVFDSATVDTNILILQKAKPGSTKGMVCSIKPDFHRGDSISEYVAAHGIPMPEYDHQSWIISDAQTQKLKAKIERIGTPLKDWNVSINYGIKTGCNEAFIISGAKKDELIAADPRSAEIIKPILRGRDIKRYKAEFADLWLIATHNGYVDNKGNRIPRIEIDNYPAVKKHLDLYWNKIEKRADQGSTPYNLRNCAYMEEFEKEKIVWGGVVTTKDYHKIRMAYDVGSYINAPANFMTGRNIKYILACTNTRLCNWYYMGYIGTLLRENGIRFYVDDMLKIPIPLVLQFQEDVFVLMSEQILKWKKNGNTTLVWESQIDLMVYKLYELTYAEAKLIDPDLDKVLGTFGLSKADFERITMEQIANIDVSGTPTVII